MTEFTRNSGHDFDLKEIKKHLNKPVKISTADGKAYEGVLNRIDETNYELNILIPINVGNKKVDNTNEERAFSPYVGSGYGLPGTGYGMTGGYGLGNTGFPGGHYSSPGYGTGVPGAAGYGAGYGYPGVAGYGATGYGAGYGYPGAAGFGSAAGFGYPGLAGHGGYGNIGYI
ncbi:hypothetical protein PU629_14760 [Pullulanibacillus sp. KACC 23026]|uniref:hypothetical protein n=1 Tax=Pullulanibacillus sp. KACC 23026 TaxID=3028315 RepID=UPI0023B1EC99|nr:hypothetical protein [Pullulanibacillus sp. KACC 23026]WEG11417.1 hypothetical protein PU629_14760 [Pullulanibacillus sp. KACC 23026]